MKTIGEIDISLRKEKEALNLLVANIKFDKVSTFKLTNRQPESFNKLPEGSGLYMFYIRNDKKIEFNEWVKWFIRKWESEEFKRMFVPNTVGKRIRAHRNIKEFPEWIPLYLGKSSNIKSRILQHYELPLKQNTFGMKLKSRDNLFGMEFKITTYSIAAENSDEILVFLEKILRDKLNPIIGR